jgi:hypothetical protein
MKAIKKAQTGTTVKDKTAVVKPKRKPDVIAEKSNYSFLKSSEKGKSPTKKDSTNYDKGYNIGRKRKQPLFFSSDMNTYMGSVEGSIDKDKPKKKLKSGGSVKAKDGKWMQKAAASIKRRGTEGKCTPISKKSCTGKAKTLALTFKKIAAKRKKK